MNRFIISLLFIALAIIIETSCSSKQYTRQQTIDNFEINQKQILVLTDYFFKLEKDSSDIFFEPKENRYTIVIGLPNGGIDANHPPSVAKEIKMGSTEMNILLKKLHWTTDNVLTLTSMLNKVNCKSISSHGDYLQLDYGSDDVCAFYYFISDKPFEDSTIEKDTKAGVKFLSKNVGVESSCAL